MDPEELKRKEEEAAAARRAQLTGEFKNSQGSPAKKAPARVKKGKTGRTEA